MYIITDIPPDVYPKNTLPGAMPPDGSPASAPPAQVSVFQGSTNVTPVEHVPLAVLLTRIQDGTYRPRVAHLRTLYARGDVAAYRAAKEQSLAPTFCCDLRTRDKAVPWEQKLLSTTGLVHFDLDKLADPAACKQRLAQHPSTVFAFVSPSGTGLKIGVAATEITDPDTYKHAWTMTLAHLKATYPDVHFNEDPLIKYLHALCYVSDDPALYVHLEASPYPVPPPVVSPKGAPRMVDPGTVPRDRRERYAHQALAQAVHLIEASVPGNRHEARCKAGYLLGGYIGGGILTYEDAYEALKAAVERHTNDLPAALRTIVGQLKAGQDAPITLADKEAEREAWRAAHPLRWNQPSRSVPDMTRSHTTTTTNTQRQLTTTPVRRNVRTHEVHKPRHDLRYTSAS